MNKPEIELLKYRDFTDVFNASFAFISQEFKRFGMAMLMYAGIPVLLAIIMSVFYARDTMSTVFEVLNGVSNMGPSPSLIILAILLSFVAQIFIYGLVPAYLGEYEEKGRSGFTIADVWSRFVRHLGAIIGYSILSGIMISIGFMFLIFPGIYLMVPLSFILYVKIIENKDFSDTFSRCFQLVKNRWWSTFGILILAYIIVAIVNWLFSVPSLIVGGVQGYLIASGAQESLDGNSLAMILSTVFSGLGQYILQPVLFIIIGFQYYTLREQKDRSSLMDRISSITSED